MGFTNWLLNRANSTSGNSSITVQAASPAFLDGEIRKMERKGYVRVGNPYTAFQYGKTTFYQAMAFSQESAETINAQSEKEAKEREEARAKRNAKIKEVTSKGLDWLKKEFSDTEDN